MKYDRLKHHRRSVRLPGYDYASPGAYIVTLCTRGRQMLFEDDTCRAAAEACWRAIPDHNPGVSLDEWVVMPNHLHGIIVINHASDTDDSPSPSSVGADGEGRSPYSRMSPRRGTLSVIVRTYKAAVTTGWRKSGEWAFAWQRGMYEHIIRNPAELGAIRRYIRNNPAQWAMDRDNPANVRGLPPPRTVDDYLSEL